MKAFFSEIFLYHHDVNQRLITELQQHNDNLPTRTYPLFCHILNAHQIWNSRIRETLSFSVQQIHDIESAAGIDANNYADTMNIIGTTDLDKMIAYSNTRGEVFTNSIADILFHVINHSTHHKGQIIADFRASGIVPLVTDYIFYKRKPEQSI